MRGAGIAIAGVAVAILLGTGAPEQADASERVRAAQAGERLEATIRRTSYGVPHILADGFADLAFAFGYAFAEDNICTIADSYVTVNAERSRWFGEDGSWDFNGNGSTANNLNSDFFYERINRSGVIERLVRQAPPLGPKPQVKEGVRGYVAGYNHYLRRTGVDDLPDPRCRGKRWVRPIDAMDVYRRFYQLASLASAGVAIDGIGNARPAASESSAAAGQRNALRDLDESALELPIGSNAYGLGGEATDNGRGMVLGNPHFPWDGAERLYQAQLTIPGRLNVAGGTLYGVPLILIGSTEGMAWSHTVATAFRFTPIELTLAPGDQHAYVVDGRTEPMEADRLTVRARTADGRLVDRHRTLYRTRYGPMITEILGLPLFPWTPARAYAMHDVNELNFRYLNHFFDTNMAGSVREYEAVQRRYQGIPWVNSIAADSSGEAYYSMEGAIPHVTDEKVEICSGVLGEVTFEALGLPTLDGSRSECDWGRDPDAVTPGIFGPSNVPRLFRRDYTHNGNDSHWLTNLAAPLEGFDRIIGDERSARTLRTRIGLVQVLEELAGGDRFTLEDLQRVTLGNRQYAGELWRDELVALCQANPVLVGTRGPADVREACPVLAAWDVRDELDSRGALLFRRFAERVLGGGAPVGGPSPYDVPFDPDDPVNTPRGLNTGSPAVRAALADAVTDLRSAGIALNAPLRDHQYELRGEEAIPIHGGPGGVGVFNAINVDWEPPEGYGNVPHGSSFVMATQFTAGACPVEMRTFVSYGNSENPASPHNSDYTRAFSAKDWNEVPFCEDEIRNAPGLEVTRVRSARRTRRGEAERRPRRRRAAVRDRAGAGGGRSPCGADTAGAAQTATTKGGALPFSGLALACLGAVGFALIAGGAALRRRSRAR